MILKRIIFISLFILPIYAAGPDDEIIKNLDFFQNMELLKDDNPYLAHINTIKEDKKSDVQEEERK